MNPASTGRWKRAFTFETGELEHLGWILIQTCIGVFAFLWPGHLILAFTISSVTITVLFHLLLRTGIRRLMVHLAMDVGIILCLALYVHLRH